MKKILILLVFVCFTEQTFAQFGLLNGLSKSSNKKKRYDDSKDLIGYTIDNKVVVCKRTPETALKKNNAKFQILKVEKTLESIKVDALNDADIQINKDSNFGTSIVLHSNYDWNTNAYASEYNFYYELFKKRAELKERAQRKTQDSLYSLRRAREKFVSDSTDKADKILTDSLRIVNEKVKLKKSDYLEIKFVNKEKLPLLSNSNPNSKTLIILNECYRVDVMAYKGEYAMVSVGKVYIDGLGMVDATAGYVLKKYLVDDLDKITVANADKTNLFKYETQSTNKTIQGASQNSRDCGPAGVTLYKGSKGGCYYLSGKSKIYVDRSCCR